MGLGVDACLTSEIFVGAPKAIGGERITASSTGMHQEAIKLNASTCPHIPYNDSDASCAPGENSLVSGVGDGAHLSPPSARAKLTPQAPLRIQ